MTTNENLQSLISQESEKKKADPNYKMKKFEILEGEIREIPENEAELFFKDPSSFSESIQRKYLWITVAEWKPAEDYSGEIPAGFELYSEQLQNPFTLEFYSVKVIRKIPEITIEEKIQTLKEKLAAWTITAEEKSDLKLLIW